MDSYQAAVEQVKEIGTKLDNKVILKEMKSVKEQIDTCTATRTDLPDEYNTRYAIFKAVSYTHLDVYKRQYLYCLLRIVCHD